MTGDGAFANSAYQSFSQSVEYALKDGFRVEVVSWKQSLSMSYIRLKDMYPELLSIVYLDPYLDYLAASMDKEENEVKK